MDWDAAYSNVDAVADAARFPPRYAAQAQAFRESLGPRFRAGIAYGEAARERFDLALPEGTPKGLAMFIHGGYWRRFSKDDFSHMAASAVEHGWAVAVPSYTLCPEGTVPGITRQMRAALIRAAEEIPGPIRIAGHSAGGHLATRLACTDVDLPEDAVEVRRRGEDVASDALGEFVPTA